MKIKVINTDGKFTMYTLSSKLKFDYELLKRLDDADLNWEYIHERDL